MRTGIVVLLFVAACGSDARPSDVLDGVVGPRPGGCPVSPPTQGGACDHGGLVCEYGSAYNPLCNSTFVCSSGNWASPVTFGGNPSDCPGTPPQPISDSDLCPDSESAVPVGQTCTTQMSCSYNGSTCTCGVFCPSSPIAQPPCNPSQGITTNCCDSSTNAWHCFDGPIACPTPRPRLGTSCNIGDECALDPPSECGQTRMSCPMGVWQIENDACPV